MAIACSLEIRLVRSSLQWTECSAGPLRWWETAPAETGPRAGVIWLRGVGQVTWWIADGDETLAIGSIDSADPPTAGLIAKAKWLAEERWWELGL